MKNIFKHLTLALAFIATSSVFVANAKETNITKVSIENSDKFTDFKMDYRSTKKDTNRLIKDLKNQIQRSLNRILPIDQSMHIKISDVDMAGKISQIYEVREIRDSLDKSVLVFDFILYGEDGKIIKQDNVIIEEKFHDLKSLRLNRYGNSYFKYEMVMFEKWLKRTLKTI